jgi:CheY-like chemotaxis protein
MNDAPKLPVVLLVEDRQEDAFLVQRAFERARIRTLLMHVKDGEEAISYLRGEGKFAAREQYPVPNLVLLDLTLPRKDGFEVLHWIRRRKELRGLRVIVLTSSERIRDVNAAYDLGANSFLLKPYDLENFVELSNFICGYWLGLDRAPELAPGQPPPLQKPASIAIGS